MIFLFLIDICIIVGTYLKNEVLADIKGLIGTSGSDTITTVEHAFNGLDFLFFFVTIGLGIAGVIMAYFVDVHPRMFFISILSFMLVMLIVPSFSNIFHEFATADEFGTISEDYPLMLLVFQNYPTYFLIFGSLITIALFAKMRRGSV